MSSQHKNSLLKTFALAALATSLFLGACKKDDPATTKIYGTITIENVDTWATWVDSGDVELTVFPEFSLDPLAGWGEVPDNFFGPGVPGGTFAVGAPYNSQNPLIFTYSPGKRTYSYEIELEPGTYSALALGFRHDYITDPTLKSATLGVHWGNPGQVSHGVVIKVPGQNGVLFPIFDYPAPQSFTIEEGEQKEINFTADFNFVLQWYQ
ncbi:MAG: hypothetical protein EP344_07980 [Bacteroidetes bacterium]|nr:MAG: hypothetical protein EP344_07980 [Bacteroidota bacterium]